MSLTNINLILFRFVCTVIILFLLLGSIGMYLDNYYWKAVIGAITAAIIFYIATKRPIWQCWLAVILVLLISMMVIGSTPLKFAE